MKRGHRLSAFAPPALVVAAGLLLSFPVWFYGWAAAGDAVFHASWHAHFSAQLGAGEFYPRWLAGMNAGLGSPAFYYYPALPYYFASLVGLVAPAGDAGVLRTLGAAAALAFVLSGLTAYAWLKKISDSRTAAAAAILYLLAPYHSAVDLYTREAYAELWAFVWMPLVLKFARGVGDDARSDSDAAGGDSRSVPGPESGSRFKNFGSSLGLNFGSSLGLNFGSNFLWLAVAYALLCASHPPATLIFSPVALAYAYARARRAGAALRAALAMMLGACLAAVYLLPALAMQDAASFADMLAFHYFERWVTFARADARTLYGLLLWGTLTTAALTACAAFVGRTPRTDGGERPRHAEATLPPRRAEATFWIATAALSALLMSSASDTVWRVVPVLQRVQFPWRFGLVLSLAAAAVVALGLDSSRAGGARSKARMLVFGGLLVCAWLVLLAGGARRVYPQLQGGDGVVVGESARAALARGRDAPEYRPRWTNLAGEGDIESMLRRICGDAAREVRACVFAGEGAIALTPRGPRELELSVESAAGVSFRVTQFYFPGWAAYLDGRPHPVRPAPGDGLLMLSVPAGTHRLRLALEPTAHERAGQLISAASLALLLWLALAHALRRKKSPRFTREERP